MLTGKSLGNMFGTNGLLGLFGNSAGAVAPEALATMGLPAATGMGAFTDAVMEAAL
jgi:hypothetical protein